MNKYPLVLRGINYVPITGRYYFYPTSDVNDEKRSTDGDMERNDVFSKSDFCVGRENDAASIGHLFITPRKIVFQYIEGLSDFCMPKSA